MASFTSKATGNWNAESQTTWNEANYPGKSSADDVTIQSGHNVTLNIATFPSSVTTITVDSGGTLTIAANMTTAGEITGAMSVTGTVIFATGATYQLLVDNNITINSGGVLTMDASGASSLLTILINCASDGQYTLTVASGGSANLDGRTKTVATLLDGALTGGVTTTLVVDDDTDWEANDYVVLCTTDAAGETEQVQLTGSSPNWTIAAPANNHADNGRVLNLTRSCRIRGTDNTKRPKVLVSDGGDMDADYVEFYETYHTIHESGSDDIALPYKGCSWTRGYQTLRFQTDCARISVEDCIAYGQANVSIYTETSAAKMPGSLTRFYMADPASYALIRAGFTLHDCEYCDGTKLYLRGNSKIFGGFHWANTSGLIFDIASLGSVMVRGGTYGQDPGGNAAANTQDVEILAGILGLVSMDDCLFASATEITGQSGVAAAVRIHSLQHDQTSGIEKEWQRNGTCEIVTDGGDQAWKIDPSSGDDPYEFRFTFVVAATDTPTVTFEARDDNTLGVLSVELGDHECGLTGIASGTPFTTIATYATKTVTFDAAADRAGTVELVIKVLDDTGGLLYLKDFAVSGV